MTAVDSGAVLPAPYLREDLADFAGYSSARTSGPAPGGAGDWAWLNANEAAAANQGDPTGASRRYPDPQPGRLRARLAGTWGVRPEELLVVRGSDEGIDVLVRGCTAPGEGAIVVAPPTFGMYAVSARLHGVAVAEAPQVLVAADRDRFELDAGAVREAVATTGAGLVFVASPGNPTGTTVPAAELAALAADLSGRALLVVDEAYGDFSDEPSSTALLAAHENVVVLRTLSKAHGLAGARIGAVIAHPELVAALGRVQVPYPLAVPAIELALAATEPDALAATTERVGRTVAERERVASTLSDAVRAGRAGSIRCVMAGEANFVTVRADDPAAVMDALAGSGVVARSLAGHPALSDGVRITVGQEHENDRVLAALTGTPAPATQTTRTPRHPDHPGDTVSSPILFVDRDGTIITEPADHQVDALDKVRFVEGVVPALLRLQEAGWRLVMVSNQDGLGTDAFPQADFDAAHGVVMQVLESQGVHFSEVLIDRSLPEDHAPTRKPGIGLVVHLLKDRTVDWARSAVVGDRETDVQFAAALDVPAYQLATEEELGGTWTWADIAHDLVSAPRRATVERNTSETRIRVSVDLDRPAPAKVSTGLGFFDHMLDQLGKHGGFALEVETAGDLHIDEHHTVEDTGLAIGQALREALGDKRGIGRYGFTLPMDESLATAAIDFSGRPYLVFDCTFTREVVGDLPTEMVEHFWRSLCEAAGLTLNLSVQAENDHHRIEVGFKAVARALRQAIARSGGSDLPSTKGML